MDGAEDNTSKKKEKEILKLSVKYRYTLINGCVVTVTNIALTVYALHSNLKVSTIAGVLGFVGGISLLVVSYLSYKKVSNVKREVNILKVHE